MGALLRLRVCACRLLCHTPLAYSEPAYAASSAGHRSLKVACRLHCMVLLTVCLDLHKQASVHATTQGSITDTAAGLDWVAANAQPPAVVMMSLGVAKGDWSQVIEATTRSLVLNSNITVIVASGNTRTNSCYIVPADVEEVISVAASDLPNKFSGTWSGELPSLALLYPMATQLHCKGPDAGELRQAYASVRRCLHSAFCTCTKQCHAFSYNSGSL